MNRSFPASILFYVISGKLADTDSARKPRNVDRSLYPFLVPMQILRPNDLPLSGRRLEKGSRWA